MVFYFDKDRSLQGKGKSCEISCRSGMSWLNSLKVVVCLHIEFNF